MYKTDFARNPHEGRTRLVQQLHTKFANAIFLASKAHSSIFRALLIRKPSGRVDYAGERLHEVSLETSPAMVNHTIGSRGPRCLRRMCDVSDGDDERSENANLSG